MAVWDNEPSIQPGNWSVETAFKRYSRGFQKAIENVYSKESGTGDTAQAELFRANVTRFGAYKAFKCDSLIQADSQKPADKQMGREKLIKTFDYWQHAEEQMVTRRARRAKRWEEIEEEGTPNVKWLPSISIERRAEHVPYYNQIFTKDSDVWEKQDVWGCKCSMAGTYRAETEHEWVNENGEREPLPELKPSRGLEGNPARTGEIFTDKASYIANAGKATKEAIRDKILRPESIIKLHNLQNSTVSVDIQGVRQDVLFDSKTTRHISNDIAQNNEFLWEQLLPNLKDIIKSSTLVGYEPNTKTDKKPSVLKYYYFEHKIGNKLFYLNIEENYAAVQKRHFFRMYALTNKLREGMIPIKK